MRKLSLVVFASAALGGLALAPGCRDATQVTVEINLAKRASCTETNGTAITVGTEPKITEQRVLDEFVTAATSSCTQATGQIGTLVVTPGGGTASIVVVVAYDASIVPSSCRPPLYTGCIVARRQFSFSEYQQLHLPITIDPECKDVPCDAFSTCRTGKCFKSEVTCGDGRCLEPGDDGSGGTSDAGVVIPDAGGDGAMPPVDAGSDSSADATTDGPDDGGALGDGGIDLEAGPGGAVGCNGTGLMCPAPTACGGTAQSCCGTGGDAPVCSQVGSCQAGSTRYCCRDADCTAGKFCIFVVSGPLPPGPNVPPAPLPPPAPLIPAGTCN